MIKINIFDKPNTHYDGKILKEGRKKFSGTFFTTLKSGKNLYLQYEKGLLKSSSFLSNEGIVKKEYKYDNQNNLLKIIKNGKEIFDKKIKHNIGLEYTCTETINNIISKTYDKTKRIIRYVNSPKLLFGFVKYTNNLRIDTRYFLNEATYKGNGIIYLKYKDGDPILNNGVIDKIIIKNVKTGDSTIINKDNNKYTATVSNILGKNRVKSEHIVNSDGKPIWTKIENAKGETILSRKTTYDANKNIVKELSKYPNDKFVENTYDNKGNIISQKYLNGKGKLIQYIKKEYNSLNLLSEESTFNEKGLLEKIKYTYFDNQKPKIVETEYPQDKFLIKSIDEYFKTNGIKKHSDIYNYEIYEENYSKSGNIKNAVIKTNRGKKKFSYEYFYDKNNMKIKTVKKDANNKILYVIEHSSKFENDIIENTSIYKSANGDILGTEILIHNDINGSLETIQKNKHGEKISTKEFNALIKEEF